jgi:hypothetical protein
MVSDRSQTLIVSQQTFRLLTHVQSIEGTTEETVEWWELRDAKEHVVYRESYQVGFENGHNPERALSLTSLRQAHSVKVLLAMDPTFQAVDAHPDPYISVYTERDRLGILIPRDRSAGFEVLDLALWLHDHVFGRVAIIGFGKETHKCGLIIAV